MEREQQQVQDKVKVEVALHKFATCDILLLLFSLFLLEPICPVYLETKKFYEFIIILSPYIHSHTHTVGKERRNKKEKCFLLKGNL